MPSNGKKITKFLAMWDMNGLEYLGNITKWEQAMMWSKLTEEELHYTLPSLKVLIMRSMANAHRNYEIYIFEAEDIDEETIRELFAECPQTMVDSIREKGVKIYSNRLFEKDRVIV